MIEWLSNLENSILLWINQTTSNSLFDSFFPFYTDIQKIHYIFIPLVLLLLFVYIKKFKRAGITYFIFLCLTIGLSDYCGKVVKNNFPRNRPFIAEGSQITAKAPAGPTSSFYSNHTSNNFAFATYTTQLIPGAAPVVFTIAALTAYSRMYVGVHYPSDVLAGALIGSLIGWLMSRAARKVVTKLQSKGSKA